MKLIEGKLIARKKDAEGEGYIVTLSSMFDGRETFSDYHVPREAARVPLLIWSSSTLDDDGSFSFNAGKPARLVLDEEGLVVAFRAATNRGFDSIETVAALNVKRRSHQKTESSGFCAWLMSPKR